MSYRYTLTAVAIVVLAAVGYLWQQPFSYTQTVQLEEGESVNQLIADFPLTTQLKIKSYLRRHPDIVNRLQPGRYVFSGSYRPAEFISVLQEGPQTAYTHVTILEGWSKYDTDAALAQKERITTGAYQAFVTDPEIIDRYVQRYAFLTVAEEERGELVSLEGYLYPDTYYVDRDKDLIDQLVYLQLEAYQDKVWSQYGDELVQLNERLQQLGFDFRLTTYGALILASIIEKEERISANRPQVASVFFNRLQAGMQIDADISLCYGLGQPYKSCTPKVIVQHLRDSANLYNTRARSGLPPTPIANPSVDAIVAVLEATRSSNWYYLHAKDGTLHLSETLSEHNLKKSKYLW